ncbi:hypothetical protein ABE288_02020 [Bacillus salipaludis]|uniref:hypothetical protein n=1 Tax=Bacillus salipaludis TaxID=2547811 RepID=UPI003D2053E8
MFNSEILLSYCFHSIIIKGYFYRLDSIVHKGFKKKAAQIDINQFVSDTLLINFGCGTIQIMYNEAIIHQNEIQSSIHKLALRIFV